MQNNPPKNHNRGLYTHRDRQLAHTHDGWVAASSSHLSSALWFVLAGRALLAASTTDVDRCRWRLQFITVRRSKIKVGEIWAECLSLSKRIHGVASAWWDAAWSQRNTESRRALPKVAESNRGTSSGGGRQHPSETGFLVIKSFLPFRAKEMEEMVPLQDLVFPE